MPEDLKPKAYSPEFLTPLNAQRPRADTSWPDVANVPPMEATDPLGIIPLTPKGKASGGGSIKGGK